MFNNVVFAIPKKMVYRSRS